MKKRKKIHSRLRTAIQLGFFLFFPSAFTAAFSGVKYFAVQMSAAQPMEITPFVASLMALGLYTVVFGRFFCGFACAFGSFGDALHAWYLCICKKWKKKIFRLPQKTCAWLTSFPYLLLFLILLCCFAGISGRMQKVSPWEVFSLVRAGRWELAGQGFGILLLVLLMIGMCVEERFFCRFFCPMGAVFSLLPVLPQFALRRDKNACIPGCSACSKNCPAAIALPGVLENEAPSACFQCQKCTDICPKENIRCNISRVKGNEIAFTLVRTAILVTLFLWVGI